MLLDLILKQSLIHIQIAERNFEFLLYVLILNLSFHKKQSEHFSDLIYQNIKNILSHLDAYTF